MIYRHAAANVATWLSILVIAGAAWIAGESLVYPHGTAATVLVLAAAAGVAAAVRRPLPSIALSFIAAAALWHWASPCFDARAVWTDLPDTRAVGQHSVIGCSDMAEVRDLARAGLIGGVFLTRRDVGARSAAAVAADIAGLQEERRGAGLPPLIVAGDQEGGPVTHLSPPLPVVPALARLAALPTGERRWAARRDALWRASA